MIFKGFFWCSEDLLTFQFLDIITSYYCYKQKKLFSLLSVTKQRTQKSLLIIGKRKVETLCAFITLSLLVSDWMNYISTQLMVITVIEIYYFQTKQ